MIAVFGESMAHILRDIHFSPKKEFITIKHKDDIRGYIFSGIILAYGWEKDDKVLDAYLVLKGRQPELFKDFLR